ncbi:MAG TPA: hypothetical protein PKY87_15965, partial [Terricaulis sp.]|nr:hypothetical protein [Terricaulis sp.]
MGGLFRKYGFAAIVAGALAAMALVVAGKSVSDGVGALLGGQSAQGAPGGAGMVTGVNVAAATPHLFTDGVQAIGTAQARESIIITPKVADTIRVIRFDSGDRVRAGQVLV